MEKIPFIGPMYLIDRGLGRFVVFALVASGLATMTPDLLVDNAAAYRIAGWIILALVATTLALAEMGDRSEGAQILFWVTVVAAGALYVLYAIPYPPFSWLRFFAWIVLTIIGAVGAFALVAKTTEDGLLATAAALIVVVAVITYNVSVALPG